MPTKKFNSFNQMKKNSPSINKTKIIQMLHANLKILEYSYRPKHKMPVRKKKLVVFNENKSNSSSTNENKKSFSIS